MSRIAGGAGAILFAWEKQIRSLDRAYGRSEVYGWRGRWSG